MPKLISLHIENVKRIKAVHVDFTEALTVIGGNNGNGKSSALDSLIMLFGGESVIPPVPVRNGAESAQIVAKLDNGMIVTRTIKPDGKSKLTVTSADGKAKYSGPQGLLESMTGSISFDALAFTRLDARKQFEMLRQLTGLDFTALDAERKRLYDERTEVNRDLKRANEYAACLPRHADAPKEAVDVAALDAELTEGFAPLDTSAFDAEIEAAREAETEVARAEAAHSAAHEKAKAAAGDVREAGARVAELEAQLERAKALHRNATTAWEDASVAEANACGAVTLARKAIPDTSDAKARLAAEKADYEERARKWRESIIERRNVAVEANAKLAANAEAVAAEKEAAAIKVKSDKLTDQIDALDTKKKEQLAATKFPVEGLSFGESGITFNGLPFEQASSAEKLRISVAIGAALAPQLKAMCIYDGSLLDEAHMKLLKELAVEHDLQILMERVGKGDECTLIIEDGEVETA
ncbi:hypothetical protein Ga0100231_005055 [Opitutaceae bacterium TAV4]|nr:hypothetical protein Ga0100231_005055 [Opitutaceae bacterium TAV4]RRK02363.1 hypothetical protein Ga0100230_004195 [Opitutaceae bacterium TAV3]